MRDNDQAVCIPKKYQFKTDEVFIQKHELGLILIDPEKRWKVLEEIMGSMGDDFFPEGREKDEWTERDEIL